MRVQELLTKAVVAAAVAIPLSIASAAMPAFAGEVVADGTFEGRSNHVTTGGVTIEKTDSGYVVKLGKDFSLDGAPDPKLGFGRSGEYDEASQFSELKSKTGDQSYPITAQFDPEKHDEIYVWCGQFSVPLGVAKLK